MTDNVMFDNTKTMIENSPNTTHESRNRSRPRISVKERKAFKKQKLKNSNINTTTIESSSAPHSNSNSNATDHTLQHNLDVVENTCKATQNSSCSNDRSVDDEQVIEKENLEAALKSFRSIPIPSKPASDITSKKVLNNGKNSKSAIDDDMNDEGGGGPLCSATLGKWFPNAIKVKCHINYTNTGQLISNNDKAKKIAVGNSKTPKSSILLFYQYTPKSKRWTENQVSLLMTYLRTIATSRNVGGRIRISTEGVNATLSAVDMPSSLFMFNQNNTNGNKDDNDDDDDDGKIISAQEIIRHLTFDLKSFDPVVFQHTDFKFIDNLPADRHFKELKIIPVQELVYYGIKEEDAPLDEDANDDNLDQRDNEHNNNTHGGIHLNPKEYHVMLKQKNTVVIDVRNHYETILGRFDGQKNDTNKDSTETNQDISPNEHDHEDTQKVNHDDSNDRSGAEYIDPLMRKSTDFPMWLSKPETQEKLANKTVLMYCTGGIRCERASSYLKKQMGDKVNGVYQLQGGIERYLKAFPDGGFWRGKNFVFDKREAVSVDNFEGDGGVIRKEKKSDTQANEEDLPSKCCVCGVKWDRYVGKKKCYCCGVPVLMCEKCMSKKPDKTPGKELSVRCPLCVKENITVPANEVDLTANGIKGKSGAIHDTNETNKPSNSSKGLEEGRKAANSVLKWGGGYASKKKDMRKLKRIPCQFGSECYRPNCYFSHPERDTKKSNNNDAKMS
jgi:predicted sulfurtransferase